MDIKRRAAMKGAAGLSAKKTPSDAHMCIKCLTCGSTMEIH